MLDLSHIPNSQQDIQVFYSNGITNAWQSWQKPRKCQWVWIMAIGGGGGGAGGRVAPAAAAGAGGGAGAATTRALFNAALIPDRLFIQVGLGGAGGSSGTAGSSGTRTNISILPSNTATNCILQSGTNASAGTGGSATGLVVTGEVAFAIGNAVFGSLSTFASIGGVNSISATTPASSITPLTSQITTPGAQGGGYNSTTPVARDGGSLLATSISPLISGGIGTLDAATDGGNGADGVTFWKPFFSLGGAGGGNSQFGIGGDGGKGGIGSGGGAGGSTGVSGGTGGTGGNGGDGLVVIISF